MDGIDSEVRPNQINGIGELLCCQVSSSWELVRLVDLQGIQRNRGREDKSINHPDEHQ